MILSYLAISVFVFPLKIIKMSRIDNVVFASTSFGKGQTLIEEAF